MFVNRGKFGYMITNPQIHNILDQPDAHYFVKLADWHLQRAFGENNIQKERNLLLLRAFAKVYHSQGSHPTTFNELSFEFLSFFRFIFFTSLLLLKRHYLPRIKKGFKTRFKVKSVYLFQLRG